MKSMYSKISAEKQDKPTFQMWSLKLTTISIYVFIAEVILGQSGRAFSLGPLSLRIVLAFWIILVSLPLVLSNFKEIFKLRFMQAFVGFVLIMAVWSVIGIMNGNAIGRIASDWTSFYVIFMAPGFVAVVIESNDTKIFMNVLKVIVYSACVLSIVTILYHFMHPFLSSDIKGIIDGFITETQFGGVALLGKNIVRIYLRSQIFIPIAIGIVFWDSVRLKSISWLNITILGILYFGLLLSYTRSYWLATFVAFIVLIAFNVRKIKQIGVVLLLSLIPFIVIQAASQVVYKENATIVGVRRVILSYGPEGTGTPSTEAPNTVENPKDQEEADSLRAELTKVLTASVKQSPIVGHGMGYVASEIRPAGWTEYFYLDMLTKFGIIGSLVFAALLLTPAYTILKFKNDKSSMPSLLTLVVIVVVSSFNPYLNNAIGLTGFVVVLMGATVCYYNKDHNLIYANTYEIGG